jgi:glycosyltransferase involved in cell wall biosynthesis
MPVATQRGGAELMLVDLARHASEHGTRLLVAFLEDGPLVDDVAALGADAQIIAASRLRHAHRGAPAVARLARLLRRARVDLAISWMSKAHLYGAPAGLASGVATVLYHLEPPPGDWLRLATALPSAGVITVSDDLARYVRRLRPRLPVRVVRPGVDLDRFNAATLPPVADARAALGLPHVPIVGTVARLQQWKGVHVLIEAMPRVLEAVPDALCVVVGGPHDTEPGYEPYLRQRVAELDLEDAVRFTGFRTDIPLWRLAMDVNVNASEQEPFSVGVLEAMALGRPVIGCDSGGTPEIIDDGVNGLLVPFGDDESLAAAIRRVLGDRAFAARVGQAARRSVEGLSTSAFAARLIAAARELRDSRGPLIRGSPRGRRSRSR